MDMKALCITLLSVSSILLPSAALATEGKTEQKLSLSNVMDVAIKNHPEIEELRAELSASEAREGQSPSLPPPMVSVGAMGERGPFGGLMENSFEVSQTVPFPTKIVAESRERRLEKEAAGSRLDARLLSLRIEVKGAYLELYRARARLTLLGEKLQILESHSKRIQSSSLSDRMLQAHVIRIQTEIGLAKNEIAKARQMERESQGALNVTLGQDPTTPVASLQEPPLSELPQAKSDADPTAQHPRLQALRLTTEALEARESRANAAWLPDFSLRYRYNRRYDGVMPNNSEVMLGVELPFLFFWQPKAAVAEASAQAHGARSKARQTENELKQELLKARSEAETLRTQLLNFSSLILPQAGKRMKIAHSIAPTDMESLTEHREAMESYVDLQARALDLRVDYEKAVSVLESLYRAEH